MGTFRNSRGLTLFQANNIMENQMIMKTKEIKVYFYLKKEKINLIILYLFYIYIFISFFNCY